MEDGARSGTGPGPGGSGAVSETVAGDAMVQIVGAEQIMALFGAEMRHVNPGGGIGGEQVNLRPRARLGERLTQAQDGQGAKQVARVDLNGCIHGRRGSAGFRARPRECDPLAP